MSEERRGFDWPSFGVGVSSGIAAVYLIVVIVNLLGYLA